MATPVPIPNTAVKHLSADNTWLETARESKSLPDLYQSLERIAQGFVFVLFMGFSLLSMSEFHAEPLILDM